MDTFSEPRLTPPQEADQMPIPLADRLRLIEPLVPAKKRESDDKAA